MCVLDAPLRGVGRISANALAKLPKFIGVQGVPVRAKLWVAAERVMLKRLDSFGVEDRECNGGHWLACSSAETAQPLTNSEGKALLMVASGDIVRRMCVRCTTEVALSTMISTAGEMCNLGDWRSSGTGSLG